MEKTPSKYIVLVGVFFTSTSSILIRLCASPSLVISAYRMLFTVLMLLLPVLLRSREELKKVGAKDMWLCILSGIFLALHFASWIASINMTTIANSTILVSCSPIFVAVASYFLFKEKLSRKALSGITVSIVGTAIIAFGSRSDGGSAMLGNTLALLGGIFVAGYFLIGASVRKRLSAGVYVFIVYLISAIALFIMCFATGTPIYPYPPREFVLFIALAFFCSILGHTVYNYMMKYVPPTMISVSTLCEPIFASVLALVMFNEIPSIYTLIGGVIVLSGVLYYILNQNK